jgi:hypothetical protein
VLVGVAVHVAGHRHAAFRGRCRVTPRPAGHGPTRLPGSPPAILSVSGDVGRLV